MDLRIKEKFQFAVCVRLHTYTCTFTVSERIMAEVIAVDITAASPLTFCMCHMLLDVKKKKVKPSRLEPSGGLLCDTLPTPFQLASHPTLPLSNQSYISVCMHGHTSGVIFVPVIPVRVDPLCLTI